MYIRSARLPPHQTLKSLSSDVESAERRSWLRWAGPGRTPPTLCFLWSIRPPPSIFGFLRQVSHIGLLCRHQTSRSEDWTDRYSVATFRVSARAYSPQIRKLYILLSLIKCLRQVALSLLLSRSWYFK